ncbi:MAG: tetratricopeptide repeat protein [Bacteroidota bacterium]
MNQFFQLRFGIAGFLLFIGTLQFLQANLPDTLLAHESLVKGVALRDSNQFLASVPFFVQARDGFIAAAQNDQDYCWERAIRASGLAVGSFLLAEQFAKGDSLARNSIAAFPEGALKQSKKTRSLYGNWARCCYYLQRFGQAVGLFEGLLKMEQERMPQDSAVIQRVLTDITYSYRFAGDLEHAIEYNHIALEWAKNRADTANIAMLYRSMAGYTSYFGEIEKSDSLFWAAVEILENFSEATTRALMMAHGDYSTSLLRRGLIPEALRYAEMTLQEAEATGGTQHRDYAASLNEIGICYLAMRDFKLAKFYLLKSLDIYLQTMGEYNTRTADIYVQLSKIHIAQLEYEVGLRYQEKAVRIREKVLGPNNPYTVNHYGNLGWVYLEMGRYEECIEVYEDAIARSLKFEPVNEYAVAFMENNLALAYQYLGRHKEAEQTIKQSIARKKAIFEPTHEQISRSLLSLGSLYLYFKDFDRAKTVFDECVEITSNALVYDSIYHAEALVAAAEWAHQTKAYAQGLAYLQEAETLLKGNSIVLHFERLEMLEVQVKTLLALDRQKEALEKIETADLEIQKILPRLAD